MTATAKNLSAFDFMRYQRSSPDYLALCNGRKPSVRSKEDNHQFDNQNQTYSSILEETKLSRIKSISPSPYPHFSLSSNPFPVQKPQPAGTSPAPIAPSPEGLFRHENNNGFPACGDALLQWGQSKRPRCSRSDSRHAGEADPSRYRSNGFKLPPRCSVSSTSTTGHSTNREPSLSAALSKDKGERRSLPSPPEKTCHNEMAPAASPSRIGCTHSVGDSELATQSGADPEKVKAEQTELPRICLSLSRKEKEEDFFAMKGTKLPQRPKKRAKNIDRSLQPHISPDSVRKNRSFAWLSSSAIASRETGELLFFPSLSLSPLFLSIGLGAAIHCEQRRLLILQRLDGSLLLQQLNCGIPSSAPTVIRGKFLTGKESATEQSPPSGGGAR